MRSFARVLSLLAPIALAASGLARVGSTPLLSELSEIMGYAHTSIDRGDLAGASAYADLILMNRPIRIQVSFDKDSRARRAECVAAAREAIWNWERTLNQEVRFVFISDPKRADVKLRFASNLDFVASDIAGHCDYRREIVGDQAQIKAKIYALTVMPSGEAMHKEHLRHTVMHEFGHVLGLEDSTESEAIMGPLDFANPVTAIQSTEVDLLQAIRAEAALLQKRVYNRLYTMRR
jgi:predicted Zn-dependent protease